MAIYCVADTHFNEFTKSSPIPIEKKHKIIIRNWNNLAQKTDQIYIIGDFGRGNKKEITKLLHSLNGEKYLIKGNHDKNRSNKFWMECGFKGVYDHPILLLGKFILSHEKMNAKSYINIHGHNHKDLDWGDGSYNVAINLHDFCIVNLEFIK
jgi:calcineurin-like phosphoesterase family protein